MVRRWEQERRVEHFPSGSAVILIVSEQPQSTTVRMSDGSVLPFRENAELTKLCTRFAEESGGITWLTTPAWAQPLSTIQLFSQKMLVFASLVHDAGYCSLLTDHILEMTDYAPKRPAASITDVLTHGFPSVRTRVHARIPLRRDFSLNVFLWSLMRRCGFSDVFRSLRCTLERHSFAPFLHLALEPVNRILTASLQDTHAARH